LSSKVVRRLRRQPRQTAARLSNGDSVTALVHRSEARACAPPFSFETTNADRFSLKAQCGRAVNRNSPLRLCSTEFGCVA
jgi:hypothetical protein